MLEVSIDTKLRVNVNDVHQKFKLKNQSAIFKIEDNVIRIYQEESPEKTGGFKASVKRIDQRVSEDSLSSSERFIRIGPTIYYKHYVVGRTRASDGRYVPTLDVRIRSGRHPGTRANPIAVRTKKRAEPIIRAILKQEYGNLELQRLIK